MNVIIFDDLPGQSDLDPEQRDAQFRWFIDAVRNPDMTGKMVCVGPGHPNYEACVAALERVTGAGN